MRIAAGGEREGGERCRRFEGEAGAAYYDPLGEVEEAVGLARAAEGEEAVGADDVEEFGGGVLAAEGGEGVDGVVGGAVGTGGVEGGGGEARVASKSGSQARVVMARRSAKEAKGVFGLRGWRPVGAKRICRGRRGLRRRPRWRDGRVDGSNVPPKSATRMMDLE